jgi:acyl carrier protein
MVTAMTKDQIFDRVRTILVNAFELDPGDISPTAHLIDELDLDSIDAIDLAVDLEKETGLSVKEDELRALRVVQDIVDLIHRRLDEA